MQAVLRDALRNAFPRYRILTAASGEKGLHLVMKHRPEVVVTGLSLPGLSAFGFIRQIKARWPSTRIVISTLSNEPEDRRVAEDAGADEWVAKDLPLDELVHAVRRCLLMSSLRIQAAQVPGGAKSRNAARDGCRQVCAA